MVNKTNDPNRNHNWGEWLEVAFRIVIGMVVLWLFFLFAVSLGLFILWPDPYYSLLQFATISTVLTIPISVATVMGYRWITQVPVSRRTVRGKEDEAVSPIIADFRIRSGMYRMAAVALFMLLATVTIVAFALISTPGRERTNYHEALPGQLPALIGPLIETEDQREALTEPEVAQLLATILNRSTYPTWREVAAAVALWLILVKVVTSLLYRTIRLASFYDSRADYLQLGGSTDTDDWQKLLNLVDASQVSDGGWVREFLHTRGGRPKTET